MVKSVKVALGAVAFAAPILLGAAYTVGIDAFAGGNDGGIGEQRWQLSESEDSGVYTIDRTGIDGVFTFVVTDPDGNVVQAAAYPGFVEEAVAEFGSDWEPTEDPTYDIIDEVACYHPEELAGMEVGDTSITQRPEGTFVIEVHADGLLDKAHFDPKVPDDALAAHRDAGGKYADIEGAQELNPCGS